MANGGGQVDPQYWHAIIAALEVRDPERLLGTLLLRHRQVQLTNLVSVDNPPGHWLLELFNQANAQGWLNSLLRLINAWSPDPNIRIAIDTALGPEANIRPEWYDEPMPMGKPFIDRSDLRDQLFEVLQSHDGPVQLLMVRGKAWGKSHCQWFLKHVANVVGFQAPLYIDLMEIESLQDLAERIVDEFGLPFAEFRERFTTPSRIARNFSNWLVGKSRPFGEDNRRWLIIFDHLAKDGIVQEVRDLAINLAKRACGGDLTNIWIALLDCPAVEALEDPGRYRNETVTPIAKQEIERFLDWAQEVRENAGASSPHVPDSVRQMLATSRFPLGKSELRTLERDITTWWRSR